MPSTSKPYSYMPRPVAKPKDYRGKHVFTVAGNYSIFSEQN